MFAREENVDLFEVCLDTASFIMDGKYFFWSYVVKIKVDKTSRIELPKESKALLIPLLRV
jgi:hypothetical protein